jgi:hypothetical protein
MRLPALAILCLCLPAWADAALPASRFMVEREHCTRIPTGPGPEDMAVLPGLPVRILISSHDRRHFEKTGAIYLFTPADHGMRPLPRSGEPAGLALRPHGMDLRLQDGVQLLYVINHDSSEPNSNSHSILIYEVRSDGLYFRQRLHSELLTSPDDLSLAPDGDLYVTNDRKDGESVLELALRRAKANVVVYRNGTWQIAADKLVYPNGVLAEKDRVLVSLTFGDALLAFPRKPDGTLGTPEKIIGKPNLDNLMPGTEPDTVLVSSHTSLVDFMRHKNNSKNRSGNVVYQVNVKTHEATPVFTDDGSLISAVSTALVAGNMLYLSQEFDDFLVGCPVREP